MENVVGNYGMYVDVFVEVFELNDKSGAEKLKFHAIPEWDSLGHMKLIASLEKAFGIRFGMEDIMAFSSFEDGVKILERNGVALR